MNGAYDDILHLPHYRSSRRPHMSIHDRAAQFSPFAALTGFDSAIEETGRLTDQRIEQEEYGCSLLDRRLSVLLEHLPEQPEAVISYFCPDQRKDGGSYQEASGRVHKVDLYRQVLSLADGQEIPLGNISDISLKL